MSAGPQIKSQWFGRLTGVIAQVAGAERHGTLLSELSPGTRRLVEHPPQALDWLPIAPLDELLRKSLEVAYQGDQGKTVEHGRRAFSLDAQTVHRFFVRPQAPQYFFERADQVFAMLYRDNGTLRVEDPGRRPCTLEIQGVQIGSPAWWAQMRGTLIGALEASRVQNIRVDIFWGGGDAPDCRLRCDWEPPTG